MSPGDNSLTRVPLSQSRQGKDPALVRWKAPETFVAETAAEMKNSGLMKPYRALATAVRNEEQAFAFWSYLAAYSEDPQIKKASELRPRRSWATSPRCGRKDAAPITASTTGS
ncbi:hypothetical protein [Bradyrhizobium guangdongense]